MLPVPDYGGDLLNRSRLSGDWGGTRTDLANKGVQVDVDWTQYVQGVVDGGIDRSTRYGGHLDYLVYLDLMRMGLIPGGLVKFRAESRYGESVNGISGQILPVNTTALFPVTNRLDEDVAIAITDLNYTQFLSEHLAVLFGKLDTLDADLERVRLRSRQEPVHERELPLQFRGRTAPALQHAGSRGAVAADEKHHRQRQHHQYDRLVH